MVDEKDQVNQLLNVFYEYNQFFKFGHKGYRKSAETIIKKIGLEASVELATIAIQVQGLPFAPVITNPTQLINKFAELKSFCLKKEQKRIEDEKQTPKWISV